MSGSSALAPEEKNELLDSAIEAVRKLPSDARDEIAKAMIEMANFADNDDAVDEAELDEELRESLAQADRGEFASDEEVRAMWAKFGL